MKIVLDKASISISSFVHSMFRIGHVLVPLIISRLGAYEYLNTVSEFWNPLKGMTCKTPQPIRNGSQKAVDQ